ncbi:pyridoxamine 5'-phosphate oxidase family protein [Cellulosimicrobium sp. PMB13]|uniref:pyridoxamine 5'-phosphate oxidase family protein n=1 Tax=Cellulosimicrobium sp. PMB13 TaxID=3120158 RepID=UPI003F4C7982
MDVQQLVAYVRAHGDGVVSTLGPDGAPQAAYLALTATDRGELVLDARATSRKVANVRRDPRVAVVVGGADGTTLQAEGVADLPGGAERDRCAAAYAAAFPQFAASLADDGIVVARVTLTWARHGDFRGAAAVMTDVALPR